MELSSKRLIRRRSEDGSQESKAVWGGLAAPEGLALLAIGVALGVAGVLVSALFAKLLSRDQEE